MPRPLNYTKPDIAGYKALGQVNSQPVSVFDPSQLPVVSVTDGMTTGPVSSLLYPVIQPPRPLPVYKETVTDWLKYNWQLLAIGAVVGVILLGRKR
jgi:hypothetical protein